MFSIFLKNAGSGENQSMEKAPYLGGFSVTSHVTYFFVVVAKKYVTIFCMPPPKRKKGTNFLFQVSTLINY